MRRTEAKAPKLSFWVLMSAPQVNLTPSGNGCSFRKLIASSAKVPDGRPNDSEVNVTEGCRSNLSSNDGELSCITWANCDTSIGTFIGLTIERCFTSSKFLRSNSSSQIRTGYSVPFSVSVASSFPVKAVLKFNPT